MIGFGENGLISVVLGHRLGSALEIDLWLMSCRVLKRDMEVAMLDALVERARRIGVETLRGRYLPTKKNALVADHYDKLGFTVEERMPDGATVYSLEIGGYQPRNRHIQVRESVHGV